jgi:regulator of cell morphogenesis and NO signaling
MKFQTTHERNWDTASLTELADHIEQKHHNYMHRQLPAISALFPKLKRAHAEMHGAMLAEIEDIFLSLREEIEMHLQKEEGILFPYIRQIERVAIKGGPAPQVHCGSVANPIHQMEHEHEAAGRALEEMRKITNDYTLPADNCNAFKALYHDLDAMEKDLHEHIHLENNILFPRAIELEKRVIK